jgi:putative RNA 2'-phosphotransferase
MTTEKENIRISKFLSLVLRHQPETINIQLDANGWTDIDFLLEKMNEHGFLINKDILRLVVETNSKKRFAVSEDGRKIRASQGHSVDVELGYQPQKPPAILYHGTAETSIASILKTGLEKRSRHHVHLSAEEATAINVGQRYGKPVVLKVHAEEMVQAGFQFYLSENGVWLTDHVPVNYISQ